MRNQILLPLGLLTAIICQAEAAVIVVENAGFEEPVLPVGVWNDGAPPGWVTADAAVLTFTENIAGFASEGSNHQGLSLTVSIWQELPLAWAPNTAYTLIVGVGNRNSSHTFAGNSSTLYFESSTDPIGSPLAVQSMDASILPALSFADCTLTFVMGNDAPAGDIRIRLSAEGNGRSHFDNVRFTATPVPEPAASLLFLSAGGIVILRHRRRR
jgi:hypothetical protein